MNELTERQHEIIVVSLMGDGCIELNRTPTSNRFFSKIQSVTDIEDVDKKDYMDWHFSELNDLSKSGTKLRKNKGAWKGKDRYVFRTRSLPVFTELEKQWYVNRVKIVPRNLKLTGLSLCIWFMDDGSNSLKSRKLKIATQSFTREENEFLRDRLLFDFGISSAIDIRKNVKGSKKQELCGIRILAKSYHDFINIIKPFCQWSCFRYKFAYRKKITPRRNSKLTEAEVLEIIKQYKVGDQTQQKIAEQFGVNRTQVSRIVNGKRWKHLQENRCQELN